MPRISSLRSWRDGPVGASLRIGAAPPLVLHRWPPRSRTGTPGRPRRSRRARFRPAAGCGNTPTSGDDPAWRLGSRQFPSAPPVFPPPAPHDGFDHPGPASVNLDVQLKTGSIFSSLHRAAPPAPRATVVARVRQDPAFDDPAHVEAPMRRHRSDAGGEVAALLHLAVERHDPSHREPWTVRSSPAGSAPRPVTRLAPLGTQSRRSPSTGAYRSPPDDRSVSIR